MIEPNFQSIAITNGIGLALLISLLISSYMTRERHHLDDRMFTALIIACAGACIFEPATWFVDGRPEPWAYFLNYLGNMYCFLGSCFTPYLWVLYVDVRLHKGTDHIKNWHPIVAVPVALLGILNIGNLFGHYMFTISDANVYSRLPLSYLNYASMFALFFYSVWLKHKYQKEHGRVQFFPMAMFLVPVIIGAALQAALFGVSLAWTSVSVGLAGIHMSLQNELSYIDPLTNLYNRNYLDGVLSSFERNAESFGGLMIDLDYFKDINDTFGHAAGDEALAQTAQILVDTVPSNATVLRYAGDEFVVLLAGANDAEMKEVKESIEAAIVVRNAKSDAPFNLALSIGYSTYTPSVDTIDEFLRRIDEYMYAQKREHHARDYQEGSRPDRRR